MCIKVVVLFLRNMLKCLLDGTKPLFVDHHKHKQLAARKKCHKTKFDSSASTASRSNYSRASHIAKVLYRVDHDTIQFKAANSHGQLLTGVNNATTQLENRCKEGTGGR